MNILMTLYKFNLGYYFATTYQLTFTNRRSDLRRSIYASYLSFRNIYSRVRFILDFASTSLSVPFRQRLLYLMHPLNWYRFRHNPFLEGTNQCSGAGIRTSRSAEF